LHFPHKLYLTKFENFEINFLKLFFKFSKNFEFSKNRFEISNWPKCPTTILAIRNLKKRTANSRSRAFATVRELSQPFASVRHRSPPFAVVCRRSQPFEVVRSGSQPFAYDKNLKKRLSLGKVKSFSREKLHTKMFQEIFFLFIK
jgi:hypothetical protein